MSDRKIRVRVGSARGAGTLGTFAGVFTPSVLTILGIILFRRMGFVVGSAGLWQALLIITLANSISVLTSISLSAIATNFRVKGGGDYYLISRTLGVEFGGAIGIVLFIAQAVSIAFYAIGFGESVAQIAGLEGSAAPRLIASAAAALLFFFAWLGADWATRLQFVIMAVLGAGLVAFIAGGIALFEPSRMFANSAPAPGAPGFWVIFAIFFPAVTGFTQGVSLSGDLKEPGKSIPSGTFAAVGLSAVVYLGAAFLFAGGLGQAILVGDYGSMGKIAAWSWLIDAGVIAATLSSAMSSFLGAPRILQALAKDHVIGFLRPFEKGVGPTDNPRRGVLLSAAIAFVTISLGNLNLIAPVVSMFFLISYGLLNYATYFEARAQSPAFRPRFRWFDARASLVGAIGCGLVMLAINPVAGVVSASLLFGIYHYLKRSAGPARWADGSRAYRFQRIREHLIAMAEGPAHDRDWRPQILAFSKEPRRREQVLKFASWLEGGSGLTTAVQIIDGDRSSAMRERAAAQRELELEIAGSGVTVFPLTVAAPTVRVGFELLLQSYGIGPVRANIVLLNWLDQQPTEEDPTAERNYGRYLRETVRIGCNLVVLDSEKDEWDALLELPTSERRIDVWWFENASSHLMLLLAYLMTRSTGWEGAKIRVLGGRNSKSAEKAAEHLAKTLEAVRIEAEPVIVDAIGKEAIVEHSRDAALVFLPMKMRGNQPVDPFGERLEPILENLPVVALVIAAEDIKLDAEPDEGKPAKLAAALDRRKRALDEAAGLEKEVAALDATTDEDADDDVRGKRARLEEKHARALEKAARAEAEAVEYGGKPEAKESPEP